MKQIFFKFSFFLLFGQLIIWWLFFYSPFQIEIKPFIFPINIHGLALFIQMLTVIIYAEKNVLKLVPKSTIQKLTSVGTIIVLCSEIIFQTIRQVTTDADNLNERLYYFFYSVIGMTLLGALISFMVAYQLITKNTSKLLLIILAVILFINLINYIFPNLTE